MKFQNVDFPAEDAELRRLIEIGSQGVNLDGVFIRLVMTASHAMSGRAYRYIPKRAAAEAGPTSRMMMLLRVGAAACWYPADNIRKRRKFFTDLRLTEPERRTAACAFAVKRGGEVEAYSAMVMGSQRWVTCFQVDYQEYYGGIRSPLVQVENWQESLVAIAAHEARHIHQFRHGLSASESDCERFAVKRLDAYRSALVLA